MLLIAYLGHRRIDDGVGVNHLGILIELLLPPIARFRYREEMIVYANLCRQSIRRDPRDETLGLRPTLRLVEGALDLHHLVSLLLDNVSAKEIATMEFQTNGLVGCKTIVGRIVLQLKVRRIDVENFRHGHRVAPQRLVRRAVGDLKGHAPLGLLLLHRLVPVGDCHLDGIQCCHHPP